MSENDFNDYVKLVRRWLDSSVTTEQMDKRYSLLVETLKIYRRSESL